MSFISLRKPQQRKERKRPIGKGEKRAKRNDGKNETRKRARKQET